MRHDLLSLKIFITIAEQGSMTKAAEQYHIAASALSKRISELEEKVGSPIFFRYPRGMELTPVGQALRRHVIQLFETIDRMDQELAEYSSGMKGHIRLHAITSALAKHIPLDIAAFLDVCPKIKFDIEEHVGTTVARAVADGKADIGIIAEQTHNLGSVDASPVLKLGFCHD
jgi:DNA-binding transcriptional LysR family regulator